jgi:hypothetical protein
LYQKEHDSNVKTETGQGGGISKKENIIMREAPGENMHAIRRDVNRPPTIQTTQVTQIPPGLKIVNPSASVPSAVPQAKPERTTGAEVVTNFSAFQNIFKMWDDSLDDLMFQVYYL